MSETFFLKTFFIPSKKVPLQLENEREVSQIK